MEPEDVVMNICAILLSKKNPIGLQELKSKRQKKFLKKNKIPLKKMYLSFNENLRRIYRSPW